MCKCEPGQLRFAGDPTVLLASGPWEPSVPNRRDAQMDVSDLRTRIEALVADPSGVRTKKGKAIDEVIEALDEGLLRVAEYNGEGWVTHAWVKHAILLYFGRMDSEHVGPDCA